MNEEQTGSYYYDLFKFFHDEHDLILLDSDIQEIIFQVNRFQDVKQMTESDIDNCAVVWKKKLDEVYLPVAMKPKVEHIMKDMVNTCKNKCRVLLRLILSLQTIQKPVDRHY